MDETVVVDFAEPIPVFPLNHCVLLPHGTTPLHVFEPRYRAMVRDAIDGTGIIAMATFDGDEWKLNYPGNPSIRDYVCVGRVGKYERLADGRYNILLQGLCRARIVDEVEPHEEGYRLAHLKPIETEPAMEIDLAEARSHINELLSDDVVQNLSPVTMIQQWLHPDLPTEAVVDLIVLTLCRDTEDRYRMLAEPSPEARARWLEHYLRRTRQLLVTAEQLGPGVTDDGYALN